MESDIFDEDEIIPKGYKTYEEYLDDINNFLNLNQILFTHNIYNDKKELIYVEKSVHSLINKEYEMLNKSFLNYFNSIKEYMKKHSEDSEVIFEFLMDLSTDELPTIPSKNDKRKNELKELFKLPKELEDFINLSRKLTPKDKSEECKIKDPTTNEWYEVKRKGMPNPPISTSLMKQKKKYEVQLLGDSIIKEAKNKNINTIIDIGCGKGYLTNYISLNSNIRIIGIEGNEDNTNKMMLRINKIEQKSKDNINKAEAYTAFLTTDTTPEEFKNICKINNEDVILTGLHPCGDLTPTLMRLFKNLDQIKSLIFIGCCYNKLTENPLYFKLNDNEIIDQSNKYGFPMSNYLLIKNKIKFHLANSYISSNPHPLSRTREDWFYSYKMRSYRTALELFIHNHLPNYLEVHYIGQIRENFSKSFGIYLNKALINIKKHSSNFDYNNKNYKNELIKWIDDFSSKNDIIKIGNEFYLSLNPYNDIIFESAIMIILNARISQVMEGLIIADRVLFLKQFCSYVSARRLFHPFISPRGIIMIAHK